MHSNDVVSPPPPSQTSARMYELLPRKVSHAPTSVRVLFSMALLPGTNAAAPGAVHPRVQRGAAGEALQGGEAVAQTQRGAAARLISF